MDIRKHMLMAQSFLFVAKLMILFTASRWEVIPVDDMPGINETTEW